MIRQGLVTDVPIFIESKKETVEEEFTSSLYCIINFLPCRDCKGALAGGLQGVIFIHDLKI